MHKVNYFDNFSINHASLWLGIFAACGMISTRELVKKVDGDF